MYPVRWKLTNDNDTQKIINNYRPIYLLFVVKLFEKMIIIHLDNHLTAHHPFTKNQSEFLPDGSTRNQMIDPINEIHHAFDNTKSLEVRAVFLDISKAILPNQAFADYY